MSWCSLVLVILYLNEPREWLIYIYNLYSHNPKYNGITIQEDRRKQFHNFLHFWFLSLFVDRMSNTKDYTCNE
jgi:hypothetical protein